MGRQAGAKILVLMVGAAALGGPSCSSDTAAGARDGGPGPVSDAAQCSPDSGPMAEPAPRPVETVVGEVPLEDIAYDLAVARCSYFSRCFGLATYVANECVDSLAANGSWVYPVTDGAEATIQYTLPNQALQAAIDVGSVQYDGQREAQCIAALMAEGCSGSSELIENIAACAGVFTCASGPDGGAADGSAGDGSAACAQLIGPDEPLMQTCTTDQDCVGVTGDSQGPNCVGGFCAASPCGFAVIQSGASCASIAAAGQACNDSVLSLVFNSAVDTPMGVCSPGLACQGATTDGGLGTCVVPQRWRDVRRFRRLQARARLRLRNLRDTAQHRSRASAGGARLVSPTATSRATSVGPFSRRARNARTSNRADPGSSAPASAGRRADDIQRSRVQCWSAAAPAACSRARTLVA